MEVDGKAQAMTTVVDIALAEIGSRQGIKYTLGRHAPWCCYFITWVFREASRPIPGDVPPTLEQASALAYPDALYALGQKYRVLDVAPGDVAFFRQSSQWAEVHCAIVVSVEGNTFNTCDGNFKGAVAHRQHTLSKNNLLGFSRFQ